MHATPSTSCFLGAAFLVAFVAVVGAPDRAAAQSGLDVYSYEDTSRDDWGRLPAGRKWGAPAGIELAPDGRSIWVIERCGDFNGPGCAESNLPPILKFDSSGNLVASFGEGMFLFPHGLAVDREGNVYVTDGRGEGNRGHAVYKFSPEGKLLLTLGQPGVGGETQTTLRQPSDVAIAPNGDIFVADGHSGLDTNQRIVKYSKDGKFIKQWGTKGSAPGQLDGAHGIAFDSQGRLFVADRTNSRIQIFDQEGNFIDAWTQYGTPSGLHITPDDVLYVADSARGIFIGSAKDGRLHGHIKPALLPNGDNPRVAESVAVDATGIVYAGENAGLRLQRFELPRGR